MVLPSGKGPRPNMSHSGSKAGGVKPGAIQWEEAMAWYICHKVGVRVAV